MFLVSLAVRKCSRRASCQIRTCLEFARVLAFLSVFSLYLLIPFFFFDGICAVFYTPDIEHPRCLFRIVNEKTPGIRMLRVSVINK